MTNVENGSKDYIWRVKCDVANCKYNDNDWHCTAKSIEVSPGFATTKGETLCSTFNAE